MGKDTDKTSVETTEDEPNAVEETAANEETPVEENATEEASGTSALLEQIEKLQAESKSHQERMMRTLADMENLRKRTAREKEEIRRLAASSIIEDLLPALDNMQLGLTTAEQHPEAKEVAKGFEMVSVQLSQILNNHGLEAVSPAAGEAFDPNFHESVAMQPSEDVEEGAVSNLVRIGYKLNNRLLRPASVVVSSGKAQTAESES